MDDERALRQRLVDVGVELVLTEGADAVGLREIARRAGVSHGAPRRYFPTHRDLLSAVARRGFEELGARCAAAVAEAGAPRDQLAALAHTYVAYALERRGMFELMFRHDLLDSGQQGQTPKEPRLREVTLPMFEHVVDLVARCRDERPEPAATAVTTAAATTAALWSNLHGIAQLWSRNSLQLVLGQGSVDGPGRLVEACLDAHLGPAAP
ncbi:TetR/AcrR family transcriptional regulator [Embleya sp. MST-111070]|uniref:TetR/AcrR family transcriptional regulator n=1 Tax=Embleya sp. MST-111070 TaxID=3398231 RepID=UPI003F73B5C7